MKDVKAPAAVSAVYRDLRDRHLLLPAVALLVALVAVPFLLKGPEEVPPPPVPVADGPQSAVTAAVLADDAVSVRNYRKRLAALKSNNPFKLQFEPLPSPDEDAAGEGAIEPPAESSTPSNGVDGPEPSTGTPEEETIVDDTVVEEDEGGNGGNGNGGNEPSDDDVEVVSELFTRRVDVMMGIQGDPKLHENVKPMTILPNEETPVVAFLGTDEAGERAAFVVAKDATLSGGTAACVPAPENCLYITLERAETATLDFGPDGQTYELRLLEIRDVELKPE